ncbi:MAG: PepSY domain-containing protein [Nitrospirae bacterium]|nr:PepSY domain-containing protein [Nitrospirota bacterium]
MKVRGMVTIFMVGVMLAGVGCATKGLFGAKEADELKEAVEMASRAKVTIDQAIKTASDKQSGLVIEAELEKKHGKAVWEVEVVTAEGNVMEVHVDADSGAVIDVEQKKPE